jgi:triacylglycerol lipase
VACAALVNIAYQQYAQWIKAGCPGKSNFHWSTPTGHFYYSAPLFWSYLLYDEPFGFVAVNTQSNDAYLVFRGTMSKADDAADLLTDQVPYKFVPGYGQVHLGFHDIYEQLQPQVHAAIAAAVAVVAPLRRFFFTGHSLGSGLSKCRDRDDGLIYWVPPGNRTGNGCARVPACLSVRPAKHGLNGWFTAGSSHRR